MAKKFVVNNKAQTTPKQSKAESVIKVPSQLFRITTDLTKYRNAVLAAENILVPIRYGLYQLYQQTVLDPQVTACIQQAKNYILQKDFCVFNKDGKENEEKTKLIRTKWFREYLDLVLDTPYWGHTLIQFEDILPINGIDQFKEVELVPRIYVKPEFNYVVSSIASLPPDGINYTEAPYSDWCLPVGKKRDLGLLLKLTPLVIWKKNAMGAWAEFIEKFGAPIRIGKTDSTDQRSVDQMEGMLKNMGVASWGLFKTDDIIELVESKHQDAFQVFDKMIERCNSEIAKLILGQTMTTDNGSSRSQAEVHEHVMKMEGERLLQYVHSVNNYQLVPLMNNLGFGMDGCYIDSEQEDEWDLTEKSTFDLGLINSGKFTLTPEYIKEKYGTEVIEVKEEKPKDNFKDYKNVLSKLY